MELFGHWAVVVFAIADLIVACVYFSAGDVARTIYWSGAGVVTFATVFMK